MAVAAVLCFTAASLLGGGAAPLGRILMAAGLPGAAAPFFADLDWRGAALYRARDWEGAVAAFAPGGGLNLGNALARSGRHAAALEAYDVARAAGDARAAANFDLVAAYYAGLELDPDTPIAWFAEGRDGDAVIRAETGKGSGRAAGRGDDSTNTGALLGLPELESHAQRASRRVFDDTFMVADRRWLRSLPDVPGAFLAARIAHERKRRAAAGLAPPEAEDPS